MKQYIILFIFTFCIQLWIGYSAQFSRTDIDYAGEVLTYSQGKNAYGSTLLAHPRSHVVGWVERYSRNNFQKPKTAFANIDIQNEVFQRMLIHPNTARAINRLKNTGKKQDPYFTNRDLFYNDENAPLIHNYLNGHACGPPFRMRGASLVIAHERGKETDPTATALVITLFPNVLPPNRH